jgi:protein ImuB
MEDRIACALIARFELALRARGAPEAWTRPTAVADLKGPGRLGVVSPAAQALGIRPGQLVVSARARCPELEVLAPDPAMTAQAEQEILRVLAAFSPRLDSDGRGAFFLGLSGLERLIAGEAEFAAGVGAALGGIGLDARVGIADRPFAAWVAARRARPGRGGEGAVAIVPPGRDGALLAGISVGELPLSEPAHELIALLGFESAAELAALPAGELTRRLGQEGHDLDRLLSGGHPFAWPRESMMPVEPERAALELDQPVEELEPLLFLGKSLLDRVLAGVAAGRQVMAELRVVARLDDRSEVAHLLRPAEPTLEARPILDLFRLWLENRPFSAPVLGMEMTATGARPASARQLSLYHRREEQESTALGRAVARLRAAFGSSCAVRPVLADRFRPEARLTWAEFEVTAPPDPASPLDPTSPLDPASPTSPPASQSGSPSPARKTPRKSRGRARSRSAPSPSTVPMAWPSSALVSCSPLASSSPRAPTSTCQPASAPASAPASSPAAPPAPEPSAPEPSAPEPPAPEPPAPEPARPAKLSLAWSSSRSHPAPAPADSHGEETSLARLLELGAVGSPRAQAPVPMVIRLGAPRPVAWEKGFLRRAGQRTRVIAIDGPNRVCGEWWDEGGFDRSYYWLTLDDGSLCWVYRDHRDGRLYLHGVAD